MLKKICLFVGLLSLCESQGKPLDCVTGCGEKDCNMLFTYVKKCQNCALKKPACSKAFCQNHETLCQGGKPLKPLSINTMDTTGSIVRDVCIATLFPEHSFQNMRNSDIRITNLNMLDIFFFVQTKDYARKLGSIRNVVANYLMYLGDKKKPLKENALSAYVDQWIAKKTGKPINKLSDLTMHLLIDEIRQDLYKRKGIPMKKKDVVFGKDHLPIHVSNMGCAGEE